MTLHRPGRYDNLRVIRSLDPRVDHHAIYRTTALVEFPFDTRLGLALAFWRTFGVPSIARTLHSSGETTHRTARRADDTKILMYTLIDKGLEHGDGRAAVRRINQLHRRFAITNDEHRYVLGTFIFAGLRFLDRYGWRELCCHERSATYHFYARLGQLMGIADIPGSLDEYAEFYDAFEREHFRESGEALELMAATKGILSELPGPLAPLGRSLVDGLLDPPLRAATGASAPPAWLGLALRGALGARGLILRHAAAPRERDILADGLHAGSYPRGYQISTVGPE